MRKTRVALISVAVIVGGFVIAVVYFANIASYREWRERQVVDLNAQGAMEVLAAENPLHYAKIERILAAVQLRRYDSVPDWLKVEFGADEVQYAPLLLTSDPGKRRLSFILDKTRYKVVILETRTP